MKDVETKAKFIELRAQGLAYDAISKQIKVSKPTLLSWAAEMEGELQKAKVLEFEALLQQYKLSREERVRALCEELKRIGEEIAKRDFTDVRSDKLVEIYLTLQSKIVEEAGQVSCSFGFSEPLELNSLSFDTTRTVKVSSLD
jgi:intein-encoded DNA endonuclease-like protein